MKTAWVSLNPLSGVKSDRTYRFGFYGKYIRTGLNPLSGVKSDRTVQARLALLLRRRASQSPERGEVRSDLDRLPCQP